MTTIRISPETFAELQRLADPLRTHDPERLDTADKVIYRMTQLVKRVGSRMVADCNCPLVPTLVVVCPASGENYIPRPAPRLTPSRLTGRFSNRLIIGYLDRCMLYHYQQENK